MKIYPIPAFGDNYLWLAAAGDRALVVDPGDAAPVLAALDKHSLRLDTLLITHHHADHTGGVGELKRLTGARVYGPDDERIEHVDQVVHEGDRIALPWLDTLFAGGCGRLFEGTPEQMWHALSRLASLPLHTRVYCAHEYTTSNLRFAQAVEPDNQALLARIRRVARQRAAGEPTVPSTLADELATNPFLRVREPDVVRAAEAHAGRPLNTPVEVFAALRAWKNDF